MAFLARLLCVYELRNVSEARWWPPTPPATHFFLWRTRALPTLAE